MVIFEPASGKALLGPLDAVRVVIAEDPRAGASWEGFVIEQLLGALAARGAELEACGLRTSDGREIDLLLRLGGTLFAFEVKLAARASPEDLARLERAAELVGAGRRYIICQTVAPHEDGRRGVLNLSAALERLLKAASLG